MRSNVEGIIRRLAAVCTAGVMMVSVAACSAEKVPVENLVKNKVDSEKVVNLFAPMEKSKPDADNVLRTAFDQTVAIAEEELGLTVEYRTYTAEDYQEKTYDDVSYDRARNGMDDLYLLNPDIIKTLGEEGELLDLSDLENAKNLREVVKLSNTVDGKLVAIPQEVVAYGLFVNKEMFDKYNLKLPEKPEDLLECCRVFKKNGIETPIGANRWWLETFVFAQAYAEMYNGGDTEAEIEALNNGESKYSDYMRPGFEYLKKLIDKEYIDAKKAYTYEAIEGEGPDFMAQRTPIVMAYWGAANSDTAYGNPDFDMQVIGFPSSLGQMPILSINGYGINPDSEHLEDTKNALNILVSDEALQLYSEVNKVMSPSKNIEVDCIPALKPLNDKVMDDVFVLASNASMDVEQWGNTCLIVRDLLEGASVDECMEKFDKLQEEAVRKD